MNTMMPLLFLAGSPGPLELLVIFAVVLVLFGPRKLPEIARSLGRMLHELRKASDEFRAQVMTIEDTVEKHVNEVVSPPDDDTKPSVATDAKPHGDGIDADDVEGGGQS
jgi:TatA/E family protein of Tat protein translocase